MPSGVNSPTWRELRSRIAKSLWHEFDNQLAEERGFRATIKETILGGDGRVDVSLVRGGRRVACEISVTTGKDWELGNIEKCLAAGYDEVVLILGNARQVRTFSTSI